MPADSVLSSELKSLQEEAAAARHRRRPASLPTVERVAANAVPAADATAVEPASPEDTDEVRVLRDQLGELVDQATHFFEDAEKNIAAHPAESVIAALLLGILIGRLLGRG